MGMKTFGAGAAVAALVLVLAACGSSSSSGGGGNTGVAAGSATGSGAGGLNTRSTSIGTVLVDGSGHTVYELAGDTMSHELCNASCQAFWSPVKSGGSALVINGHPAFTFTQDSGAGQTHGQGQKDDWGTWFALDANGNPIGAGAKAGTPTKPASSPSSASSSASSGGSGGYGY